MAKTQGGRLGSRGQQPKALTFKQVADALGVSERTAYRMMDRHGYK